MTLSDLNIEPLANREFLFKKLKNRAFKELFLRKKISHPPFITVSREPGSGGRHIARRLAEHLHYKFYDREILDKIFQNKGEKQRFEDLYDEKEITGIEEFFDSIVYSTLESQDAFVKRLVTAVTELTLHGRCVILGRGANFFTDHKFGFHVRITAPLDFRVEMTRRYEHMSRPRAEEWVKKVSRDRHKFVEKYFTYHIDDSEHYDLILNRAYYSIESATNLILNAFKKKMGT